MTRLVFRFCLLSLWLGCIIVAVVTLASRASDSSTLESSALAFVQLDRRGNRMIGYYDLASGLTVTRPYRSGSVSLQQNDTLTAVSRTRYVTPRPTRTGTDLFLVATGVTDQQITHIEDFPPISRPFKNQRTNVLPHWSPDEQWIAFVSIDPLAIMDVYLIHPDGSGLQRIARDLATPSPQIAWIATPERDQTPVAIALVVLLIAPLGGIAAWVIRRR